MTIEFGIIFAFCAMLFWGIGDFLIQRSTRSIGNWETLFGISILGTFGLLPFVWGDIPHLFQNPKMLLLPLVFSSGILLIAAILEFEALRIGKISVVEPIWSLEIPASVLLAFFIIGEKLLLLQICLIIILIFGLILVSFRGGKIKARHFIEKGAILSAISAIVMGIANFYMGIGGRITDALMMNFVSSFIIFIVCLIYLAVCFKFGKMFEGFKSHGKLIFAASLFDNLAWIAFVFSMTLAPIGIAVALSESYIIIAVLLGVVITKEKILKHQKLGLFIALFSAILLAIYTI